MTVAYNLLESARISILVGGSESCNSCHGRPPCATPSPVLLADLAFQSRPHTLEQRFVIERFCHELHSTRSQSLHPHFFVAVRCDEDDGNLATFGIQMCLQFETRHSWHADIGDYTASLALLAG